MEATVTEKRDSKHQEDQEAAMAIRRANTYIEYLIGRHRARAIAAKYVPSVWHPKKKWEDLTENEQTKVLGACREIAHRRLGEAFDRRISSVHQNRYVSEK